jgi:hypothetical protein
MQLADEEAGIDVEGWGVYGPGVGAGLMLRERNLMWRRRGYVRGARWCAGAGREGGRVCPSSCSSGIGSVAWVLSLSPFPVGVVLVRVHSTLRVRAVERLEKNQKVITSNACAGSDWTSQLRLEI